MKENLLIQLYQKSKNTANQYEMAYVEKKKEYEDESQRLARLIGYGHEYQNRHLTEKSYQDQEEIYKNRDVFLKRVQESIKEQKEHINTLQKQYEIKKEAWQVAEKKKLLFQKLQEKQEAEKRQKANKKEEKNTEENQRIRNLT